jgi:O-antigen/teichoic acid export membrane protein
MPHLSLRIIKNAASNLVRGGFTAAVSFALPHFLTRQLDPNRFAAWSLMLQIAAYASFLDFGLQMAIARYVSQSTELGLVERRLKIVETSLSILAVAAVGALLAMAVVLTEAKSMFHGVPANLLREFQLAGFVLCLGTAVQLVFSAFSGTLVGLHRNELVAVATAGGRVCGAIAVIVLSRFTHSLIVLASATTVATIIAGLVQCNAVVWLLPEVKRLRLTVDRAVAIDLYHFCVGLTGWMLSMFMISGLDITIVGHFRFQEVGYYAIAASAVALLVGLDSAVLSALLAPLAAFHARHEYSRISRITLDLSWGNTIVNGMMFFCFLLVGHKALVVWVGSVYANNTFNILSILLLGQVIRLIASPFAVMLISCGFHAKGIVSGLAEGIVNLGCSCYFVRVHGAIGVAYGTLIGAIVSLLVHIVYTLRTVHGIPLRRYDLILSAGGLPILALLPFGAFSMLVLRGDLPLESSSILVSIACAASVIVWTWRMVRSLGQEVTYSGARVAS